MEAEYSLPPLYKCLEEASPIGFIHVGLNQLVEGGAGRLCRLVNGGERHIGNTHAERLVLPLACFSQRGRLHSVAVYDLFIIVVIFILGVQAPLLALPTT